MVLSYQLVFTFLQHVFQVIHRFCNSLLKTGLIVFRKEVVAGNLQSYLAIVVCLFRFRTLKKINVGSDDILIIMLQLAKLVVHKVFQCLAGLKSG